MELKRRANGKGCAVYLGSGRAKPWGARITLGLDKDGISVRHFIGTFESQLEALFCLEQYHKNPKPIYIKTSKYNRIVSFASSLYPLVPVDNPRRQIIDRISKENYTFAQVLDEFSKLKFPTDEEKKLEKTKNIKPKGKFVSEHARKLRSAGLYAKKLHNMIYKELTTSHFQSVLNEAMEQGYSNSFVSALLTLFKHLDDYALQEDIISKGYSQYAKNNVPRDKKRIKTIFTTDEIYHLHNLEVKTLAQQIIKDMFLLALYTGCRASEIIFTKNKNIFLDKNYLITGIKTEAGINREIPLHPVAKEIVSRYYDKDNEFLFMYRDKVIDYNGFGALARRLFSNNPAVGKHTIHECRHTFRTELERLNIKNVTINAILGHKNKDVGLDVYTHISLEEKLDAVRMIDYSKKSNLIVLKAN